jgi:proliferating cell nuclear antigen
MRIFINNPIKAEAFTAIVQNLRNFTETINIQFTEAGLSIQTMDTSHISVVELVIPSSWFTEYECEESEILGVHFGILSKILATKDKSQSLTLNHSKENEDKLEIHFVSSPLPTIIENAVIESAPITIKVKKSALKPVKKVPEVKIYDTHFEIPLIDIESEAIEIPPIDYAAEFSLSSTNFSNIVSQLRLFGDTMDIDCSEEKIVLYSHGVESGKMCVEINIDELTEFAINEGETLKISFALNYLHNICAFHKLTKEIQLKICDNYPLCAIYSLGDDATVKFYLAPKITDDD